VMHPKNPLIELFVCVKFEDSKIGKF